MCLHVVYVGVCLCAQVEYVCDGVLPKFDTNRNFKMLAWTDLASFLISKKVINIHMQIFYLPSQ